MTVRRLAVMVALVAVSLLLVLPWAERRAIRNKIIEDARWASTQTFERPVHQPGHPDGSVIACLDARFTHLPGLTRPPTGFTISISDGGALPDGGASWIELQRANVALIRECLREPRVGNFDSFGFDCGPPGRVERSLALHVTSAWLQAELAGFVDGGVPLEACLDATALERDGVALDGLVGGLLGGMSATQSIGGCVEALVRASAEERARAISALEIIRRGQAPFSTVLKLERATSGVSIYGSTLAQSDVTSLPESARRCVASLQGNPDTTQRIETWLMLPELWHKAAALEQVSVTDPLLETSLARSTLESGFLVSLLVPSGWNDWPRFARRYGSISRKTDALLAVGEGLRGHAPAAMPWMRLVLTDSSVKIEIELDGSWKTFDVDR